MKHKTFFSPEQDPCAANECALVVDDLASVRCKNCGAFYDHSATRAHLKQVYGDTWKTDYLRIQRNINRAQKGDTRHLTEYRATKNGKLISLIQCYEGS